jgi:O-antigen/teichoic acid export membrane protein
LKEYKELDGKLKRDKRNALISTRYAMTDTRISNRNVLFVARYFPPAGNVGGQRSLKFAKYLPDFGLYYFSFERSRQPFFLMANQVGSVTYSAFSRVQDDLARMRRAYIRGTQIMLLFVFPFYILLIGLADPVIPWVFGSQWQPAVPVFRVFAAFCLIQAFAVFASAPILALNYTTFAFGYNLYRVATTIPVLVGLGLLGADILTTAMVIFGLWMFQLPIFVGFAYKKMHLGWHEFWDAFGRLLLATAIMSGIVMGMRLLSQWAGWADWFMALTTTTVSCGIFAWMALHVITDLRGLIRTAIAER